MNKDTVSERARAEETLRIQHDLAIALSSTRDLTQALDRLLEATVQIEGIDSGGAYLVDSDTGQLNLITHLGLSPQFIKRISHYRADSPHTHLVMAGNPVYRRYSEFSLPMDQVRQREGLRALAVIPVQHERQSIAALNLASHTHDELPASARDALEAIALQVGGVIARVRTEETLRESQQNLQTLFDALDDFLFILDAEGGILHVNPAVERRLGYSAQELAGISVLQVHPPERREEAAAIIADMMAGKQDACPIPLMAKDGTLIPVETKVTQGLWNGRAALFGISRDITKRKRTEDLVRIQRDLGIALSAATELDQVLNLCVEGAIQASGMDCGGIYLVDDTSGALDFVYHKGLPPGFLQAALHYEADTANARLVMKGEPVYTSHRELGVPLEEAEEHEELRAIAVVPVRHEGRVIACLNIASHSLDEMPLVTRNALETVASRIGSAIANKQTDEKLRESEAKFSTAFHSSPSIMAISTVEDERFIDVNKSFSRIIGYSREETIGRTSTELKLFADPEEHGRLIKLLEEQGSFRDVETSIRVKTGAIRIGLFSAEPIEIKGEQRLLTVLEDITERVQAEEKLKKYRDHLEELVKERTRELEGAQAELVRKERLAAMGQLTATVAHEIRNPLSTVRTAIFAIGDAFERDEMERIPRALQLAERNIVRCDYIISELLDYTHERVLQPKLLDADTWLDAMLDDMQSSPMGQTIPEGIVCNRELNAGVRVLIDHEHLRRAVVNIVNNAIDALQDEGAQGNHLTVSTHVVEVQAGSRLEIRVSDTGPGIPDDVLPKVFEPLFSTKSFGVGLGLPIVKNIMAQHGGGVSILSKTADDEQSGGTNVVLWLPIDFERSK